MRDIRTTGLDTGDRELARRVFSLMAEVFEEAGAPREDFWTITG